MNAVEQVNNGESEDLEEALDKLGIYMTPNDVRSCELEMVKNYGQL